MNEVMRIIKEENLEIMDQKFELECRIDIELKKNIFDRVINRFENIRGVNLSALKNNQI
jgi:hypothetical protein